MAQKPDLQRVSGEIFIRIGENKVVNVNVVRDNFNMKVFNNANIAVGLADTTPVEYEYDRPAKVFKRTPNNGAYVFVEDITFDIDTRTKYPDEFIYVMHEDKNNDSVSDFFSTGCAISGGKRTKRRRTNKKRRSRKSRKHRRKTRKH
jgi:hypothetical protein